MDYLIDSSVLVNSIIGSEDRKAKALAIISDANHNLYISNLTMVEVYNALRYEIADVQFVVRAIKIIEKLKISTLVLDKIALDSALRISIDVNDTVYDASYHSLALIHDLTFVTFDGRYYQKAKHLGNIKLV